MTRKIIGAKLVFRIKAMLLQIGCPFFQKWPVALRKGGVAFGFCQRSDEQQHVGRLFDHHLAIERLFTAAINLSGSMWITAQVVRSKIELPMARTGVVENGYECGFQQCRTEEQKMRRLRVKHINRADTAVAVVFLAEEQRLTALIGGELRAGQGLPVTQRDQLRVLRTTNALGIRQ